MLVSIQTLPCVEISNVRKATATYCRDQDGAAAVEVANVVFYESTKSTKFSRLNNRL